jgi:hypothetical protein
MKTFKLEKKGLSIKQLEERYEMTVGEVKKGDMRFPEHDTII